MNRRHRTPGLAAAVLLTGVAMAVSAAPASAVPGRSASARLQAHRAPTHRRRAAPVVTPILTGELVAPMRSYRRYVAARLVTLQSQVATLVSDLEGGNVVAAEAEWLTAHMTWLDIGQDDGAYGAFGGLGREIDGTAAGLELGVASPGFTGFHRIEFDLWTEHDPAAAARDGVELQRLVGKLAARRLVKELPGTVLGLTDWTLRCHEILEDALRDSLSGEDDYGSGTDLESVIADVAATREVLGLLAPVLDGSAPHLVGQARRKLTGLVRAADAARGNGRWAAITSLTVRQRERVDGAIGAVLETLAPVPDLLHILNDSS
jgi:high-affinity iron transporter